MNSDQPIRTLLKNLTKSHVPKKSDSIKWDLIHDLLNHFLNDDDPADLVCKIWVALMYFGLLQNNEAIQIQVEDVEYSGKYKTLNVIIPFSTKHRVNRFSFFIPKYLHELFALYYHQIVCK